MKGLDRVILLLRGVGPELAGQILARLGPGPAARIQARMQELGAGPEVRSGVQQALQEATRALSEPVARSPGLNLVVNDRPADEDGGGEAADKDPIEALRKLAPDTLAAALEGENARTIAILLNLLDAGHAGEVYKRLNPAQRREVSVSFARQPTLPVEMLRTLAQSVVGKSRALKERPKSADPAERIKKLAEMFRLLPRTERAELLVLLGEHDATTALQIKGMLYQFEDLLVIENPSVQKILGELDTKTLATALSGASPEIRQKILSNLTKRAQDSLQDEIELQGTIPKSRAEQARKEVCDTIGRLDERGELQMPERE